MQKTKLGISATLFVAALYFLGLYGGYVITGILVGYVLLKEEDSWLKKQAVRVLGLMILFSLASTVINLVPNVMNLIYNLVEIFETHFYVAAVHSLFNLLGSALSLFKTVLFVVLGVFALQRKDVKIPALDGIIDKFMD